MLFGRMAAVDVPVAEEVSGFHQSSFADVDDGVSFLNKAEVQQGSQAGEGGADQNAVRMAQVMMVGQSLKSFAIRVNPLQGVNNLGEARVAVLKEAKDLFNPTAFSKPKDRAEWTSRLSANTKHFKLSYSCAYALTSVWFVLTSPFLLFEIGLVAGLWAFFYKVNGADDVVTIGQYKLGRKEKMMVLVPLTLFLLFFGGVISSLVYMFFLGSLVVGTHASFRQIVVEDPLDSLENPGMVPPPPASTI